MDATHPAIIDADISHIEQINTLGANAFGLAWYAAFPRVPVLERTIRQAPRNGWRFTVTTDARRVTSCCIIQPHRGDRGIMLESVWSELAFIAVADDLRGHGLGTQLVDDVRQRLLAAGKLGLMATIQSKAVAWYTKMGWHIGESGHMLTIADVRTKPYGPMVWVHPSKQTHPRWAWTSLNHDEPVIAWTTRSGQVPQSLLLAELARQHSTHPA